MNKLLLIDGNSLFHRAYHALPPLTDRHGEAANAVFGFSNMLIKAINEVGPDYVACAFDTMAPTFRHIEFEKYKAQRPAPPPDLYPQLPKVKRMLDAFGIAYFEKDGYEADDLLATIASKIAGPVTTFPPASARSRKKTFDKLKDKGELRAVGSPSSRTTRNFEVIILSGDRDCLQLVDGNIKVQMPGWNLKETTLYGAKEVKEKYGLESYQMVDYKSLIGDPSDNIPGIAGIGPKTAAQLLQKYHTLENLFKNTAKLAGPLRRKLAEGRDVALAAQKLVELDKDVDLRFKIEDLRFKPDWNKVRTEYEELGFKSIVNKIPVGSQAADSKQQTAVSGKPSAEKNSDQLKLV